MVRSILVTGGAGFIASNFINYWSKNYTNDKIIVLDCLTYAGNINNLQKLIENKKIIFIKENISNQQKISEILKNFSINTIVHMAAESHVDKSIENPIDFIDTNIVGTFNLLESFRKVWSKCGFPSDWKFLHISTDEVFGSLNYFENSFNEESRYNPRSPYSASKAASDHLAKSWFDTYEMPVIISNCSNNYGPYQFPEKLIPKIILNCIYDKEIPIYGDGKNIRDWLFVDDHIKALEKIIIFAKPGTRYCIGGNEEKSNIEITKIICNLIDKFLPGKKGKSINLINFVKDRPGHDFRYSIDSSLMKRHFNWEPQTDLKNGLRKTIDWYLNNKEWWEKLNI